MCSAKNLISALARAEAHGRRASTGTAHLVIAEKDGHRLGPCSGGVPLVQQSWELFLSETSLFLLSIGRSRSVEPWRDDGAFVFFLFDQCYGPAAMRKHYYGYLVCGCRVFYLLPLWWSGYRIALCKYTGRGIFCYLLFSPRKSFYYWKNRRNKQEIRLHATCQASIGPSIW